MKTLFVSIGLLFMLVSCRSRTTKEISNLSGDFEIESEIDITRVNGRSAKDSTLIDLAPFVVFGNVDTVFIPDTAKISNIYRIGDQYYYYTLYESYQFETDFGKNSLIIRNNKNELQWSLEFEDYTKIISNEKYIVLASLEKDQLEYYDYKSGHLLKKIKLDEKLSDLNDILMTEDFTYIKLVSDDDAKTRDVMVISNANFDIKLLDLKLNSYYSLKKEKGKVFLQNGNEKRFLN